MTKQEMLVAEARSYLGVRWRHQGRTRTGIDCAGLVVVPAAKVFGTCFDIVGYPRYAKDESLLEACREHLVEIRRSQMQPGDVLVMAYAQQRHMGIVGQGAHGLTIIHSAVVNKMVVEQILDDAMRDRVVGCFRFPEATT